MTNFHRIKEMSVDEMVDFIENETDGICECCVFHYKRHEERCWDKDGMCKEGIKKWLEREVEE